jgi:hypothetical protein
MLRLLSFDMDYHWACNRDAANHVRPSDSVYVELEVTQILVSRSHECSPASFELTPPRKL